MEPANSCSYLGFGIHVHATYLQNKLKDIHLLWRQDAECDALNHILCMSFLFWFYPGASCSSGI